MKIGLSRYDFGGNRITSRAALRRKVHAIGGEDGVLAVLWKFRRLNGCRDENGWMIPEGHTHPKGAGWVTQENLELDPPVESLRTATPHNADTV